MNALMLNASGYNLTIDNQIVSYANKVSFDYYTYDISFQSTSQTAYAIPFVTPNYAGKKLFASLELYGTGGYTSKSYHWCAFNQDPNLNNMSLEPNSSTYRPTQRRRYRKTATNAWSNWDTTDVIHGQNGLSGAFIAYFEIEMTLKNSNALWFLANNSRYWKGSRFRLVGSIYYN